MSEPSAPSIRVPVLWVLIAGLHIIGAAYAWRMLPHGFDWDHPRFWTNQVLPFAIVAAGLACVVALWRRRARIAALTIAVFVGMHLAIGPAWKLAFPISGTRVAVAAIIVALVLGACAFASLRRAQGMRVHVAIGAAIGLFLGAAWPFSQRGGDPDTHPVEPARLLEAPKDPAVLPAWVGVSPNTAALSVEAGPLRVELYPLLEFISRSPDRGWTLFADAADRIGPPRHYTGDAYRYEGDEPAVMRLSSPSESELHVETETVLPNAVYSHLNSFCWMTIRGHRRLFLAFSPMPSQKIEVTYSQYPTGKPSRFAYVDAASVLHVVEATSGEKGPFTELARGPLPRTAKLGITLYDDETPIADIELADFAWQASTQTSPTAGWGVPENAIEFSLTRDSPAAPASIFMTLAGTSVGRGFDSVGHAPGLYRNRINIRRR